ncbi:MAG: ABC transporter substrate-binding protein, partial [Armatimonadaceae bacterium]
MDLKRRSVVATLLSLPLTAGLMLAGCGNNKTAETGGAGGKEKLIIFWADWEPAKQLATLVKEYPDADVEVKTVPWSSYESDVKKVWTSQNGDAFDMVVGDSQWLGAGAEGGHYVELSDWAKTGIPMADIEEAAIKNYGEYPAGSGKLYAVPAESDCIGFAYRKDLFEDPKNKEAFKAKYGKDLAVPATWDDFQKVAEFFTKADGSMYGAALFYSKDYDGATMGFDQVLWSFGGQLNDGNGKVDGVINSAEAIKALEFHVGLKKF